MAMSTDATTIRELHPDELGKVRELGRRAFSLPMGLLMAATVSPQGWVTLDAAGVLIGALTVRTAQIGKARVGILDWAVVDPRCQGQGIGKALLERALLELRQQGCDKIITTGVDGYNTSSWNAAYAHGLRYWPPAQQIREVGWRWPKLLLLIPHIGVSTFILHLPARQQQEAPATAGVRALLGVILFLGLFLLPVSAVRNVAWASLAPSDLLAPLAPAMLLWGALLTALYLGVRGLGHWLAARALRLPLTFRLWDSGLLMATLLAVAFGAFLPAFGGSYYVRQPRFDTSQARPALGKIMLAGVAPSLALLALFTLWGQLSPAVGAAAQLGRYIGLALGLTDTLLFFSPFQALPAGHIWRWRRAVWLAVLLCFLAIALALPRMV
jgi:GNAT superfamily N-acetyltransferase